MFVMENLSVEEIERRLAEPFREDEIEWRVMRAFKGRNGKNYAFVAAYIESRAIQNRLDEVLGIDNWENTFSELHKGVLCGITIHLPNGKKVTKYDGADLTAFEVTKGGISGAFKRAAVQFGIGRYLYNLKEKIVEISPQKINGGIYMKDSKNGIEGYWVPPQLPNWALPKGSNGGQSQRSNPTSIQGNQNDNRRTQIERYIIKFENELGLSKKPEYIVRIFNKANSTNVEGLNSVRTADTEALVNYYNALMPVYQLERIRQNYQFPMEEFLRLVQIKMPKIEIEHLYSCFFEEISREQIDEIEVLARDTAMQRQAS